MPLKFCSTLIDNSFNIIETPVNSNDSESKEYLYKIIQELRLSPNLNNLIIDNPKYSIMGLCNYKDKSDTDNAMSVIFMYLTLRKTSDGYRVLGTNWLDYIKMSASILEDTHLLMDKLDKLARSKKTQDNGDGLWKNVSKAGLLKAFEPLANFTPKPLRNRTNSRNLYNVMNSIYTDKEKYSKDYVRNFFNKVITNMKEDFDIVNISKSKASVTDAITNENDNIGTVLLHTELTKPVCNVIVDSNVFLEEMFTLYEQSLKNEV